MNSPELSKSKNRKFQGIARRTVEFCLYKHIPQFISIVKRVTSSSAGMSCEAATNEKAIAKIRDMVQNILQLDKSPVAYGGKTDNTKTLTTSDRHGDDTVGYGVSDKEPDEDRGKITREEHERNNEHVTRIGKNGKDLVKRVSDEKGKRKKYTALDVDEHAHCGEDRPLLILFENIDAPPPMLAINNDSAEYPIYEQTKGQPEVHNRKMIDWVSELDAERRGEIDEEIRMVLSKRRVIGWKKQDIYPKISIPARATK